MFDSDDILLDSSIIKIDNYLFKSNLSCFKIANSLFLQCMCLTSHEYLGLVTIED